MISLHERHYAILALILVNALWGLSFPMMKCLNLQIDQHFGVDHETASTNLRVAAAAWLIGLRFAASLILFGVLFSRTIRSVRPPHACIGVGIGALFFIGLILQVIALGTIPASRSGFLTSLAVVFTPLIWAVLHRRRPRWNVLAGAATALLGVAVLAGVVVISEGRLSLADDSVGRWTVGDSLTVLSAIFFSAQILLLDQFGRRYDSVAFTPSMFATTAVLGFAAFAIVRPYVSEDGNAEWGGLMMTPAFFLTIVLLCAIPSVIAFAWMNKFQPRISAGHAAVIYTLEPVFASIWAMSLPATLSLCCRVRYENEQFSLPLMIGGLMVLAANLLALWPPPRPEQSSIQDNG
ncbi:MAG: DMT family transporter [Pirellulaceae bacterium]